jgi:hypothetical protein
VRLYLCLRAGRQVDISKTPEELVPLELEPKRKAVSASASSCTEQVNGQVAPPPPHSGSSWEVPVASSAPAPSALGSWLSARAPPLWASLQSAGWRSLHVLWPRKGRMRR